jgi:hypothetical protein
VVLATPSETHAAPRLPAYGDPGARFLVDPSDRAALWHALEADRRP